MLVEWCAWSARTTSFKGPCESMATSVPDEASQQGRKANAAGIALSADTTRLRAVSDPAASLASEGHSHSDFLLPVFDLAEYLSGRTDPDARLRQCCGLAECLRGALSSLLSARAAFFELLIQAMQYLTSGHASVATGCVVVRDPRTSEADSKRFLDMMERYFSQGVTAKMADVRPELHYQVVAWTTQKKLPA